MLLSIFPAAIAQDFALNDNIASDSHTVHIDTILPTVESITGIPIIEKNEAFDITITFSEPVNDFVARRHYTHRTRNGEFEIRE